MASQVCRLAWRTGGAVLLALAGAVFFNGTAHAAMHRAGVVVQHSGSWPGAGLLWRCVQFSQEAISGLALLELAGINSGQPPQVYDWGAGALTICQVNGEPATVPDRCFGPVSAPNWSDWTLSGSAWGRRSAGVTGYTIRDGDVEGWTYSAGFGSAPPVLRFSEVCPPPTAPSPSALPSTAAPRPTVSGAAGQPGTFPTVTTITPPAIPSTPPQTATSSSVDARAVPGRSLPRPTGGAVAGPLLGGTLVLLMIITAWNLRRRAP